MDFENGQNKPIIIPGSAITVYNRKRALNRAFMRLIELGLTMVIRHHTDRTLYGLSFWDFLGGACSKRLLPPKPSKESA